MLVDSVNINGDKAAARDVRFKVGLVFQYPEYQLFEETVYADIAFGPKNMKLSESEIDERVREAAALVGVGEELFERSPLEPVRRSEAQSCHSRCYRHAPGRAHPR